LKTPQISVCGVFYWAQESAVFRNFCKAFRNHHTDCSLTHPPIRFFLQKN
jgi:hypothetical protein